MAEIAKAGKCPAGGYVAIQQKLLDKEDINCPACIEFMKTYKVCPNQLDIAVERALQGEALSSEKDPKAAEPEVQVREDAEEAQQEEAVEPEDPFDFAKSLAPTITLLSPGDHGRKLPFRCNICKTAGFPDGKIGELNKASSVRYFLTNHINSGMHQENLRKIQAAKEQDMVQCNGLLVNEPIRSNRLYSLRREFHLWASMSNIEKFAKHTYFQEANTSSWRVKSHKCLTKCVPDRLGSNVCDECLKLGSCHGISRTVSKFGMKYWPAKLLNARLFLEPEVALEVEAEIRKSGTYDCDGPRLEKILKCSAWQLQQVVRASWTSHPNEAATEAYKDFVATVVQPCLHINPRSLPDSFASTLARFSACLASGHMAESEAANLRLAVAHLGGVFEAHPLLQGMSLQCLRKIDKTSRGVTVMTGRKSKDCTNAEINLVQDAGLTLAIAACNKQLAKKFPASITDHYCSSTHIPSICISTCCIINYHHVSSCVILFMILYDDPALVSVCCHQRQGSGWMWGCQMPSTSFRRCRCPQRLWRCVFQERWKRTGI